MTSSQPIRLRERLPAAWMLGLVLLASALLLPCIPAGQDGRPDADAGRIVLIAKAGDRAASTASAGHRHAPPASTPVPALHQDHAWLPGSPCDGEDGASDRAPCSMTAGRSPRRTVALLESSRSAARWRHRGRGPPLRA